MRHRGALYRSEWIHTSIRTVSRLLRGCFALFRGLFRAISRVLRMGLAHDSRLFRACFACDSRVVSRHGVLHATTNGRGMNFHPFA
eukprot:1752050-Prymnesium_polylepis.1